MTSNIIIPKNLKVNKLSESKLKSLVGRKMTKSVKFMGEDVKISKLTVSEVLEVQQKAKTNDSADNFDILKTVIKASLEDAKELSDEDFDNFPIDELSKLSSEIMKFSGLGQEQGK